MRLDVNILLGHSFLPALIDPAGVAFDFGANQGEFSRYLSGHCAQVFGIEADPGVFKDLPRVPRCTFVNQALAHQAGKLTLNSNQGLCSSLHYAAATTSAVTVDAVTLETVFALTSQPRITFVKMDIEGEEVPVLQTAPASALQRVTQLTVEFHDFLDPKQTPQAKATLDRMRSLGFQVFRFPWFTHGDVLLVNRAHVPLSALDRARILFRYKFLRGARRFFRRQRGLPPQDCRPEDAPAGTH